MATVDLDALAAELRAVGIPVDTKLMWDGKLRARPFAIAPDGRFYWGPLSVTPEDIAAIDIIRRHVAPAPPVVLTASERDQLARAMHDHMHSISGPLNYDTMAEETRDYRRGSIDAVLAKLAELGIVLTREARP